MTENITITVPAAIEGRCNHIMMNAKDGVDRCANAEGHRGSHVSWATKKRTAEKANPEREAKRIALMREIAAEYGYKITAQTAEAKQRDADAKASEDEKTEA